MKTCKGVKSQRDPWVRIPELVFGLRRQGQPTGPDRGWMLVGGGAWSPCRLACPWLCPWDQGVALTLPAHPRPVWTPLGRPSCASLMQVITSFPALPETSTGPLEMARTLFSHGVFTQYFSF